MGSDTAYPEERPAHRRDVESFVIDMHPVTNAEFRRFVKATGWVTTAEKSPNPADFPGADAADLVAGSLVFTPTGRPVPLDDWQRWWRWTPGADWRHPQGPESTLHGLDRHPVVHVSYEDAAAFADWSGKALPTEQQWEYAARAGTTGAYAWGEEFMPRGRAMANTWRGEFPWRNDDERHPLTSPVGSYPANGWGLLDMIGNVWEWTSSPWTDSHGDSPDIDAAAAQPCCGTSSLSEGDRRTIKGGSHLCAPSYCQRYRPAARQGQAVRSTTSHVGFRCVGSPDAVEGSA
jgi:formylglycine-generating enzyme required for sulfatase activity